jgi:hypothetical protein
MKSKPELPGRALLFLPRLASLSHGGFPPYSNPIFRSGEVCRHSKINSAQGISLPRVNHPMNLDLISADGTWHVSVLPNHWYR